MLRCAAAAITPECSAGTALHMYLDAHLGKSDHCDHCDQVGGGTMAAVRSGVCMPCIALKGGSFAVLWLSTTWLIVLHATVGHTTVAENCHKLLE